MKYGLAFGIVMGVLAAGAADGMCQATTPGPSQPSTGQAQSPPPAPAAPGAVQPTSRITALTATSAPVYVLPDATRTPLRVLTPGTRLRVLRDLGDWLRVEFHDPRWGARVGYIERKNVDLSGPDLDTPAPPRRTEPRNPATQPPAQRRGTAKPQKASRVWIDVGVGVARAGEEDYSLVGSRAISGQTATLRADYHLPIGIAADVGGGFMATRRIGAGVTVGFARHSDPATLTIDIPHPILQDANATDSDVTNTSLRRTERSIHIHGVYVAPTEEPLYVRVFGGPTFFQLQQDLVEDIRYAQDFLPFDPIHEVNITGSATDQTAYGDASGWGFHAGADVAWYYTPLFGVGVATRYSRGTVEVVNPLSNTSTDLDVGGFQVTGGLRLRF